MERESRRWTRRRVVYGALGLASAVAGAGWAASEWEDERERREEEARAARLMRKAYPYAFCGRLGDPAVLRELMQHGRHHAPTQLLLACWFTHTGDGDSALRSLTSKEVKDSPEALFLRALVQRRPQATQWHALFIDVWHSLGKPDFRSSTLLPEPLHWNDVLADTVGAWDSSPVTRRLSLVCLDPSLASSHSEEVQALIRASTSLPLLMALREHFQGFEPEEPLRRLGLPVIEERVTQLTATAPQTLQCALRSFLGGTLPTQPLTRKELETLEVLSALPVWMQPSSEQVFLELREQLAELAGPGHHAALLTHFAQGTSLGSGLLSRTRASQTSLNDEDRRWLGRLLWTVGARLRERHSLNEVETGLRLQMLGSEWSEHMPSREDCIEWWVTLGKWQDALARSGFARWPIASLLEESFIARARDELAWVRAFDDSPPPLK